MSERTNRSAHADWQKPAVVDESRRARSTAAVLRLDCGTQLGGNGRKCFWSAAQRGIKIRLNPLSNVRKQILNR